MDELAGQKYGSMRWELVKEPRAVAELVGKGNHVMYYLAMLDLVVDASNFWPNTFASANYGHDRLPRTHGNTRSTLAVVVVLLGQLRHPVPNCR